MEYKAIYETDDSLTHYGVLGMRWGHRKQRPSKGGIRNRLRKKYALHKDPKKELREVEGNPNKYDYYGLNLSKNPKKERRAVEGDRKLFNAMSATSAGGSLLGLGAGLMAIGAVPVGGTIAGMGAAAIVGGNIAAKKIHKKNGDKDVRYDLNGRRVYRN